MGNVVARLKGLVVVFDVARVALGSHLLPQVVKLGEQTLRLGVVLFLEFVFELVVFDLDLDPSLQRPAAASASAV